MQPFPLSQRTVAKNPRGESSLSLLGVEEYAGQVEVAKEYCTQGFLIQSIDLLGLAAHDIAPIDTLAAKVG